MDRSRHLIVDREQLIAASPPPQKKRAHAHTAARTVAHKAHKDEARTEEAFLPRATNTTASMTHTFSTSMTDKQPSQLNPMKYPDPPHDAIAHSRDPFHATASFIDSTGPPQDGE
eukprot:scaffold82792_cov33-Tisochrysis_lutea.AAC.3